MLVQSYPTHLKLTELLAHVDGLGFRSRFNLQDVETDRLGQRTALTNGHNITFLDTEARRDVGSHVLVALFETLVLLDVVQVVAADDDGALHLGRQNNTLQDTATDRHIAGERALLVDVAAFNSFLGGLEAQTDRDNEARSLLLAGKLLGGEEDALLLLEGLFVLQQPRSYLHVTISIDDAHPRRDCRRQTLTWSMCSILVQLNEFGNTRLRHFHSLSMHQSYLSANQISSSNRWPYPDNF
ncbi:hypothetical protein Ae201684_014401 [Aphanomyces euteiches]|uniref:Uncharacterized protein n=1 Tax=Aphanomyces euteiches TaxID=100861 RepID=A0A6G0WK13_9STRA|nr:hypothetical protein Ae201684_014401 [Aphanomyces euteiches]